MVVADKTAQPVYLTRIIKPSDVVEQGAAWMAIVVPLRPRLNN